MSKTRVIRFEAINAGAQVIVPGTYRNAKGDQISILRTGKVVSGELTPEQRKNRKDIHLKPDMPFTMALRDDPESAKELDAWCEHILAVVPGARGENLNKNCLNPQFKIVDVHKEIRNRYNNEKLKLAVANTVNNMTPQGLYNAAFAIGMFKGGVKPEDVMEEDVWVKVKTWAENNPLDFGKLVERKDLEVLVVINKAIALNILKFDRGRYSYHTTDIGGTAEEAMTYFRQYEEQYKQLRRQVASNDNLPVRFTTENVGTVQFKDDVEEPQASAPTANKKK